ncbi:hypothetical protein [Thermomonas aquatica]|uniref:DUF4145 domain-containing protein n=1 Tax=Thermomonas aquatica TaxID=2202149 RepID=A0A5B7ZNK8_9GAMM|nr:hypothetical protein [Thermomonas aquatica]QDA56477.1 hypothetical protein FHQ07_03695 [Thermomonas aquatica]
MQSNTYLSIENKIAHNLGVIVLASQEIESTLKFLTSVLGEDENYSVMQRYNRIKKKPLGEMTTLFASKAERGGREVKKLLKKYVNIRNEVVHHFVETYSKELTSGDKQAIVFDLASRALKLQSIAGQLKVFAAQVADTILNEDRPAC